MTFHHFFFLFIFYFLLSLYLLLLSTEKPILPVFHSSTSSLQVVFQIKSHSKHIYWKKMQLRQEEGGYNHKIFLAVQDMKKVHKNEFWRSITRVSDVLWIACCVSSILATLMKFFQKTSELVPDSKWEDNLFLHDLFS